MTTRGGPQYIPRPAVWTAGERPEWMTPSSGPITVEDVVTAVTSHEPGEIIRAPSAIRPPERGRASAVLIAVYDGADGATMILTRRPQHMRKHAGEVAFPGGSIDDGDESSWAAAVREAHEEVHLDPTLPIPVGQLDHFVTGASFSFVTPWVARLDERPQLRASPDEVDQILHVPLEELLQPDVYRQELWLWEGSMRPIHFFELVGDTIWGATALMVHQLLDVITPKSAT